MTFPGTLEPFPPDSYLFIVAANTPSGYAEFSSSYYSSELTPDLLLALYYLDQVSISDDIYTYSDAIPLSLYPLIHELTSFSTASDISLIEAFYIDSSRTISSINFDLESLPTTHPELFL